MTCCCGRTRLGQLLPQGLQTFTEIGRLCQQHLGWNEAQLREEIDRYQAILCARFQSAPIARPPPEYCHECPSVCPGDRQWYAGVRAIIVDDLGNIIAKGREELEPYFSDVPGWAEQHPAYYWAALGKGVRAPVAWSRSKPSQIGGVTLTTQRGTVVCLDPVWRTPAACHQSWTSGTQTFRKV